MANLRPLRALLAVLPLLALLAPSPAVADPRTVQEFLRDTTPDARRALYNEPGNRPALAALGEVLERRAIARPLLRDVISNPHARPYLADTLRAIRLVDRVPGVENALQRMARARDDAGTRGASFEIIAGACLRDRLACLSSMVGGHEVDGLLRDGTIMEAKDRRRGYVAKASSQLALRCQGRRPAMLMLSRIPDGPQLESLRHAAGSAGNGLQVLVVDRQSLTARPVLTIPPRVQLER